MAEDWEFGGFGLYIHWPFCEAKCPYCDFNSYVSAQIDQRAWLESYLSELDRVADETKGRVLQSVFFGGGTPSLMDPHSVSEMIDRIRTNWPVANDLEVTLEANPSSIEASRFARYQEAGVNRVSVGIQALNDSDLKKLGRLHSAAEALSAVEIARTIFDRVSIDLIYARQDQTASDWEAELTRALSLGTDHISLYQLTIEQGTAFAARHAKGLLRGLPDEELASDLFHLTNEICAAHGFHDYETSNHAREFAPSRHNLIYWRSGDYVGIGPGAHGRLTLNGTRFATSTPLQPNVWLKQVADQGSGELSREELAPGEHADEFLMMGLRLSEGIDLRRLEAISSGHISPTKVTDLTSLGLIKTLDQRLSLTEAGKPLLNAVLRELLT